MASRKRDRTEMESLEPNTNVDMQDRLRNMWEFSNLMQFIFIFGKAVKIDEDFTIEDLETECLKPEPSDKLAEIGLALLKYVSSHRGLTLELFDEYTRRQYVAKAPLRNPFGTDESPRKFADFDIFTKIRVLSQLSRWTLINADRMRERMPETKDTDQVQWRIEEIGYDKYDRLYFVLDDNRLYRRTDPQLPPPPAPKPKANSRRGKALARANKRRKTAEAAGIIINAEAEDSFTNGTTESPHEDGFGGRKWECIAISLGQYQSFLGEIQKSRNLDEKALHQHLVEEVLPVIEKAEEVQLRRNAKKERELLNMQKLATAKRSSRLADKLEREREEQETLAAERKRQADLLEARKDQERQRQMEQARVSRMMTREQRLKEREFKRILQEEELANLSEDSRKIDTGEARLSERRLKAEMEKRKRELAALAQEDEWSFDCSVCGVHGENLDDGSHSVACETCNVWQHSACHGISKAEAEKDNFHFICHDCRRRAEDAKKPKIPTLKFRLGSSSSPPSSKSKDEKVAVNELKKRKSGDEVKKMPTMKRFKAIEVNNSAAPPFPSEATGTNSMHQAMMNGPTLSPHGQILPPKNQSDDTTQAAPPPPGLRSPPISAIQRNGYSEHLGRYGEDSHESSSSPVKIQTSSINGVKHNIDRGYNTGWSARYSSSETALPQQKYQQHSSSQSSNPPHNSFDLQQPSPSRVSSTKTSPSATLDPVLPSLNGNILNTPGYSPPSSSTVNGANPHPIPQQHYSHSPVKQLSSPPPPPRHLYSLSSSPVMHPPLPQSNGGSFSPSAGLSPTKKQSPPQERNDDQRAIPVLPPVRALEPSP